MPAVFGIYGHSNTGKTTLIKRLISQLTKEGYIVAAIKQTKKTISLDTMNKDTWKYHTAGARLVVFSSYRETDFLFHNLLNTSEIIRIISSFGCYEIILIEGAYDANIPKIRFGSGKKRKNTLASYNGDINEILAIIKQALKKASVSKHLIVNVNGKKIPLTDFPELIITNTIIGMLGSLKDVQDIKEVTIELKR